ncbi:MFS/sugar transport protein-domain-containing protein [Hyaloraphidium curvatum]|nr:MFS/sugar transport protein-domain-containing protein [Hyaloraphidium curvatum]
MTVLRRVGSYLWSESSYVALLWALPCFLAGQLGHINGLFFNDAFVNRLKIRDSYFVVSNLVFAVIDPLNDVVLAWWVDSHDQAPKAAARRRLSAARVGGTLWALCFALQWALTDYVKDSPLGVGLVYFAARTCFDTCLTLTWICLGALTADVALKHEDRVKCHHFASMAGLMGLPVANVAYRAWAKSLDGDMSPFRRLVLVQSAVSIVGFQVVTRLMWRRLENAKLEPPPERGTAPWADSGAVPLLSDSSAVRDRELHDVDPLKKHRELTLQQYARQVLGHSNFMCFIFTNVPQETLAAFLGTFFTAFIAVLLNRFSVSTNALIVSAASFPINLILYPVLGIVGISGAQVWTAGIYAKIALCLATYFMGPDAPVAIAVFLVCHSLIMSSIGGQFSLICADLADEDQVRHRRPNNQGARFMGTNALFTKPPGALVPLVGRAILGTYDPATAGLDPEFRARCFAMMTLIPLAGALLQALVWSRYDLRGDKLAAVKREVAVVRDMYAK